jgi:hypothetical protein
MPTFTKQQIKEISEQLMLGFRAFYHRQTGELIFVPNEFKYPDIDTAAWQDELDKLDEHFINYCEVEAMESRDSFQVMEDFADQVSDTRLQSKLFDALNKRHPFREFKFVIDNSGEQRERWFEFRDKRYYEWTEQQLERNSERD